MDHFSNNPRDAYEPEYHGTSLGITFLLSSHRRFIPNAWLLYSDMNKGQTQLQLHYTHSVVTVTGTHLFRVYEQIEAFKLKAVREMPTASADEPAVTHIEIAEQTEE